MYLTGEIQLRNFWNLVGLLPRLVKEPAPILKIRATRLRMLMALTSSSIKAPIKNPKLQPTIAYNAMLQTQMVISLAELLSKPKKW